MSITRPILRPVLRSPLRSVFDVGVGVATPAPNALSPAKLAIEADAGDVNLLVLGDSTGDATTEWIYLFAEWLAAEYPTHSVSYRTYNTGDGAYVAATAVSTGSGTNTIRIWNGSVSLTLPQSLMGQHFSAAVEGVPTPDLVVWNYGHNILSTFADGTIQGEVIGPMEMVRLYDSSLPHAYVLQNPRRDDNTQATKIAAIRAVAERRGDLTLVNFYDRWITAGKPAGWYADNIHPNAVGSEQNRNFFAEAWEAAAPAAFESLPPWLNTTAANLLTNGDFSNWPDALPAGWTINGDAVVEQDAVIVDGDSAYSLRITGPTATAPDIRQSLSAAARNALAGSRITLAARLRASDSGTTTGAIHLQVNSSFIQAVTGEIFAQNGWRWVVIADVPVPETVTAIAVRVKPANTAIAGAYTNFDRVILVEGSNPRDML